MRLVKLASQSGCTYSRYADDLTFSTNKKEFPPEILKFKNLKFLTLSKNEIAEIPNEINKLQLLIGIDLSNNPISDVERNRIRKLVSTEVEILF